MVANLYSTVETAIIARLSPLIGLKVEGFPDDAKELGRAQPLARILVGYQSSSFRVVCEDPVCVEETLTFEVTLAVKGLRTHQGAYLFLSQIKMLLIGFIPVIGDVRPMRPRSISYKSVQNGIWFYSMSFILPVMLSTPRVGSYTPTEPIVEPVKPVGGVNVLPPDVQIQIDAGIWRGAVGQVVEASTLDRLFSILAPVPDESQPPGTE